MGNVYRSGMAITVIVGGYVASGAGGGVSLRANRYVGKCRSDRGVVSGYQGYESCEETP